MTAPQEFEVESPQHPQRNADLLIDNLYTDGQSGAIALARHRESFFEWSRDRWRSLDGKALEARIYAVLKDAVHINADGDRMPFSCSKTHIGNIVNAMELDTYVDNTLDFPSWVQGRVRSEPNIDPPMPANEMVSLQNGLLHAPTRRFFGHTPQFFNSVSVPFNYDPAASSPERWLNFLAETWPDDAESIECLQEIFGYLLTSRTDLHKMFMLIGPPRTGKSTISRIIRELLGGQKSVGTTDINELNGAHGLQSLTDKQLAVMGDLRFRGSDTGLAVSRILGITGEDDVTINPKNRDIYTARLSVRFLVVSNELPSLRDESGAIKSRLVLLKTLDTVPDWKIDSGLTDALIAELPGIFNWSLDGLDRLMQRGQFQQPKSGLEDLGRMTYLSSPMQAFIDEYLTISAEQTVASADLYRVYSAWCRDNGMRAMASNKFISSLSAVATKITKHRPRDPATGKQYYAYSGVGLNDMATELLGGSDVDTTWRP